MGLGLGCWFSFSELIEMVFPSKVVSCVDGMKHECALCLSRCFLCFAVWMHVCSSIYMHLCMCVISSHVFLSVYMCTRRIYESKEEYHYMQTRNVLMYSSPSFIFFGGEGGRVDGM